MAVTAQMVKELRESTGAGMMDAKKALTETNGDMEAAVDWLRTKGLAKAAKKADRVAAEGLVGVQVSNGRGVAIEINSGTGFVAKDADFQQLVREISEVALETATDVEVLRLHYAETLKIWRENFLARRDEAVAMYDERFARMWEFYLAASEASFRYDGLVVFQLQLAKRLDTLPMTRDYMLPDAVAGAGPT